MTSHIYLKITNTTKASKTTQICSIYYKMTAIKGKIEQWINQA